MELGILSTLPDLVQGAITVVDAQQADLPVVYCNAAFERLTGYASAEVIGRNLRLLQGPDTKPEERAVLRSAIAAGEACTTVIRNYRKDGSAFWAEVRLTPVRDAAGRVTHFIGEHRDVTDREESQHALRDSEARFRAVLESAPDATLITDSEGRIVLANARLEELFGYTRAELLGESVALLMPPALRAAHGPKVAQFVHSPRARMMGAGHQLFACRKDGSVFPADISLNTAKMGEERVVVVAIRDVTDRQQILNRLVASESDFRKLAELVPVGVFRADISRRLRFGNAKFFAISGLAGAEAVQGDPLTHLHPEDRARVSSMLRRALCEPTPPVELRYVTADGQVTYALGHARPDVDADGNVIGILGAVTDITAYKTVEAEVRHQAALLNLANDAIVERSLDRRITFWNDGAARLYGWSRDQVLGELSSSLLSIPSERTHLDEAWKQVLAQGSWHGELQRPTRDGRRLVVQSSWTLVRNAAGDPHAVLSIDTDVTERRDFESQVFRAQRMDSLGTMAGGIAHDLNNVLQSILLAVAFLRSETQESEQLTMLDLVHESAQRGADLIRQILTFARGADVLRAAVQVELIVEDVLGIVRRTISKDIDVNAAYAEGTWKVSGDATQLHQVVMNLCLNAADAMPHGGTITASVGNVELNQQFASMHLDAATGRYVMVRISDTGTGMSAEVLDRVFEPFFTTKGPEKGTGLGLATVHAIVRGHGGFIKAHSEPGAGTTFTVYLPAAGDTNQPSGAAAERPGHLADLAGHDELILVVDDEDPIREVTRATLEKFGYRVVTAADGVEAFTVYAGSSDKIAAVLTDMMMPVLGGVELIDALRRIDPAVKVLAMSGLVPEERVPGGTGTVPVPFLHKPCTVEQLLEALAQLLHS